MFQNVLNRVKEPKIMKVVGVVVGGLLGVLGVGLLIKANDNLYEDMEFNTDLPFDPDSEE